ncbi:MAG: FAD:protein FMN transferase [Pedobacter sp.]|nr:MAG: FAD:protein FMN transferase [Pedobacter sp.]
MLQYKTIFLWIPLLIILLLKKDNRQLYVIHGYAQGTDYSIKYYAKDSVVTQKAIDSILLKIDSSMSLYKSYSLINKFNASYTGVELDRDFLKVVKRSFDIFKATNGIFDVTVKPLVQAWGFGSKPITDFPDSLTIKHILQCVGMHNLHLKGSFLSKQKSCVQIDLNGIAQGYSVDVVADYLLQKGIKSFVVEIGGELRIKGRKPDGSFFRIGIEGPADVESSEPAIKHIIQLNKGAITTSGNYRKYLQQGSKKISHLIDAKTGYPLQNSMISVTLYAKDAITADGYDNAIMAMEPLEALRFIKAHKELECYLIYHKNDGSIADTLSSGFRKLIVNDNN